MKKLILWNRKSLFVSTSLLLLLSFMLVAIAFNGFSPTSPLSISAAQATSPDRKAGARSCPEKVDDPSYWDHIIGTHGDARVESVHCGKIMQYPGIQALVNVRHSDTSATLNVYVFNNITNAKPKQIFKLTGLVKGDAKISGYDTIMTAEVDTNSTLNRGKSISAMTVDLFREFQWSSAEGTLVQIAFPGIFPDLTRYQAEADQALVKQGQDTWKNDPVKVAKALADKFFAWQRTVTARIISGGGPQDVYAKVLVQESPQQGAQVQGPSAVVTLSRLEGNTHNIWVAIAVEDGTLLTLTNIEARSLITSPVTLEGTGGAFEAVIGRAFVFDHLYNDIGHAQVIGDNGFGKVNYSTKVVYTSSFKGVQEGVVAVYESNGGISNETYLAVMVKVLLNPEPEVVLGPLLCPDAVKDPAYWNAFISMPPSPSRAESVTCGNMLDKIALQAMVVAREIIGGGPTFRSVFVFDKITDPKPGLLFKVGHLYHGEAQISGYSTILTGEVDLNSPINKGQPDAAMTVDLFREFQWSDGAGAFQQIVFPGMFPDLTRWQAEADQKQVNQGQDSWKLDAVQTTKNFAAKFLQAGGTTTLVSGGGHQDLNALVNLAFPSPGGGGPPRITKVTLSRLEGHAKGIWEVTAVTADWLFISSPRSGPTTRISSPVTVTGFGPQFEAQIGVVWVLDHLYNKIGQDFAMAPSDISPPATFTVTFPYTSSFHAGAQEGIMELLHAGGASFDYGAVMVKVLISA